MSAERIKDSEAEMRRGEDPGQDLVRQYLNEIIQYPLLKNEEVVELAEAIEVGLLAKHRLDEDSTRVKPEEQPQFDDEERKLLLLIQKEGEQAKEAMINCNLRYVVSLAKRYQNRGLALLDLIQFGNLGLIHAVEKFDYKKGFTFSTYANHWIRQSISRGLADESRTIRIPVHMNAQINKLNRIERELTVQLARVPTIEELAREMGKSAVAIKEMQEWDRQPISVNAKLPEGRHGSSDEFGEIIVDESMPEPMDYVSMTSLREALKNAIEKYATDDRDREIVMIIFGLSKDGQEATYEAVGEKYGLNFREVRNIIARILRRIKKNEVHLRAYLQD